MESPGAAIGGLRYLIVRVRGAAPGQSRSAMTIAQPHRIRVGIADDHPIFLDSLCLLLSMEDDMEVVATARDGNEAVHAVLQYKPDVLLLDLQMPGRDGIEILRELQRMSTATRVVVLTASDDFDRFAEAVRHGSAGVILKQSAIGTLAPSIRKVHAGEVCLDADISAALVQRLRLSPAVEAPPPQRKGKTPAPRGLTPREGEVVQLLVQGLRNRDIADRLFMSEQTVKNHLNSIFGKLQVSDRLELALYAIHQNDSHPI